MTREEALKLVESWTANKNLVRHMLAVEAQMQAIYKELKKSRGSELEGQSEEDWGLLGLIHDADYEKWPEEHPNVLISELENPSTSLRAKAPAWLIHAVKAHAWKFNGMDVEPSNLMEWAIYTCDELSGFIVACTLVRPTKKLADVAVADILKKWPQKSFAAGVHREQIELCEEKLGIKLSDYIDTCLKALQSISVELGL